MTEHMLHAAAADTIRRRRQALGLSRERLAVAAGVAAGTVARIERGSVTPYRLTVNAILDALSSAEAETKSSPAGRPDSTQTTGGSVENAGSG